LVNAANPLAAPQGNLISSKKLVERRSPPDSDFANKFIEKLCKSPDFSAEISKFESTKIRQINKSIDILEVINSEVIDIDKLKKLAFTGIPNRIRGLRPIVWRLIMGELPQETSKWQETIDANHETYEGFKRELIVKPKLQDEEA